MSAFFPKLLIVLCVCSGSLSLWLGIHLLRATRLLNDFAKGSIPYVQDLTAWLLLACGVTATLIAFSALLLGMHMRRWQRAAPMVSLLAAVERAAHGDYAVPIATGTEPEFTELARGVEWLRSTLLDQQQRLNERMQVIERSRLEIAESARALDLAYRREAERRQELASLAKATAIITAQLQTESLLALVLREAIGTFRTAFGVLLLSRGSGDHLELAASVGHGTTTDAKQRFSVQDFGLHADLHRAHPHLHTLSPGTSARFRKNASAADPCTVLVAPLAVGRTFLGALVLEWEAEHVLSAHESELAQTFASHASVALENARLYATLSEERRLLSLLSIASGAVNATHELSQLYPLTVEHMAEIAEHEADAVALAIYSPEEDGFTIVSLASGKGDPARTVQIPLSMSALPREESSLWHDDLSTIDAGHETFASVLPALWPRAAEPLATVMMLPLLWQKDLLGMLIMLRRVHGELSEPRRSIVRTLAHHAAIAMKNSSLLAAERAHVQRLARSNELRAEFTSMVSHELKNPLAMLHNYATLLLNYDKQLQEEQRARYLRSIHKESAALIHLVADILDVSKIDAEILDYTPRHIDLDELVREMCDEYRTVTEHHPVTYDGVEQAHVIADPQRIQQVLSNFLDNAVKYSPEGGNVDVTLTLSAERDTVTVSVRDQGVGMTEEEQEHLFKKFSRIHNERTATIPGTGLGLYICARILTAHGGTYAVLSQPNGGTTMSVTLPLVTLP